MTTLVIMLLFVALIVLGGVFVYFMDKHGIDKTIDKDRESV